MKGGRGGRTSAQKGLAKKRGARKRAHGQRGHAGRRAHEDNQWVS